MNKTIPTIEIVGDELIIRINKDDLAHIAEHKSDSDYKVLDTDLYLKDFMHQVENYQSSNATELGMSELQYLFDQFIDAVYEDASDAVISKEEE